MQLTQKPLTETLETGPLLGAPERGINLAYTKADLQELIALRAQKQAQVRRAATTTCFCDYSSSVADMEIHLTHPNNRTKLYAYRLVGRHAPLPPPVPPLWAATRNVRLQW